MNNIKDNKENLYLSTLAFIDEDSIVTNEHYLLEFCKLVIYQNGYRGLNIGEICERIKSLVLFDYTEEEIESVIRNDRCNEIICEEGVYSITSEAEREIAHREKIFGLRKHIDIFCDSKSNEIENYSREDLCNLLMRFLFEKFQQSIEQIVCIIDGNKDNVLEYSEEYTEEEKTFINSFLSWDNAEKNIMVYNLIVKSYDFCTLNCSGKTAFDFSKFHFFLDANIIMRLLGINNTYRQNVIKHFIDKCKKEKINLHVSCFTKAEIIKSIEHQITGIARDIADIGYMMQPTAMKFAKSDTFTIEMYGKYFEYCNKNKERSYDGFKRYLLHQLEVCLKSFDYEDEMSFEVMEPDKFSGLVSSLKQIKDEKLVKTDVNNILLVCQKRNENDDIYMISTDARLIQWSKQIFVGKNSLVEFPSVWLSLIMKYTGRASGDDYASFCRFIRLPINASNKDIKKKIAVKRKVLNMDVPNQIKDRILEELEGNYIRLYQNYSIEEVANRAYEKVMKEHDQKIRSEGEKEKEEEIKRITEREEQIKNSMKKQLREKEKIIEEQDANSVENRLKREVDMLVEKNIKIGERMLKHKNLLHLISSIAVVALGLIIYWILWHNKVLVNSEGKFAIFLSILGISVEFFVIKFIDAIQENMIDKERLEKKYTRKLNKKYKELLK